MRDILDQIRSGVLDVNAEVTGLLDELAGTRSEVAGIKNEPTHLRAEVRADITELRHTVARVARVNDEMLFMALDSSERMAALEGRVRALEGQVEELRSRQSDSEVRRKMKDSVESDAFVMPRRSGSAMPGLPPRSMTREFSRSKMWRCPLPARLRRAASPLSVLGATRLRADGGGASAQY